VTVNSANVATKPRNMYLDVLRGAALVRVVAYHLFDLQWLTWAFPAIGVMFALAGSLMARSLDGSASMAIHNRVRRLLPAFWLFGLIVVPVMIVQNQGAQPHWQELTWWVFPLLDPRGTEWGINFTVALWYIRAYLWFVMLSPLALLAYRRYPVRTLLAPIVVVALAGTGILPLPGAVGNAVLDFATFGACWLLGFAHRDGTLQRVKVPLVIAIAAVAMAAGAAWAFTHSVDGSDGVGRFDLNEIPLAQALWSLGFVLVLLRFPLNLEWVARTRFLGRFVAILNARAVTIYLWHNAAIFIAFGVVAWFSHVTSWRWINVEQPLYALGPSVILIVVAVLLFGWAEDLAARRRPELIPGLIRRPVRRQRRGGQDALPKVATIPLSRP
jgi:peptidoglycan/LPS O-acetylase OafA/YrhL